MARHKESGVLFLEQVFEDQNDYWEVDNCADCS
ncbi:hypothetical protein SEA_ATUIN_207 [Arthrobacter phage Atuin]|nr:hypothetical protein SEA_ATUIN_6 [Arthrobacter phage Atuin]